MNNKGFTLVELLAVIIILSLLVVLASTSVSKIVKDSKNDLYDTQIELIKSAAEAWGADNLYELPDAGTCKYLTLKDLKQYGLIDPEIKNPKTNELFPNNLKIKITGEENSFGLNNITYEVDVEDIKNCGAVYPICTLVSGEAKEVGSKYQCKVKDSMEEGFEKGYYFYVLDTNEDGTTNLIMDQNINSNGTPAGMTGTTKNGENVYNLVAWNNESGQSTNAYGPVTAMQFLYNATKDWTNIDPVNYTYNDKTTQGTTKENTSYISFESTNGVATITPLTGDGITIGTSDVPLRARMPIYASDASITEVANKTDANAYLYDNLDPDGNAAPYGYRTLSSSARYSSFSWNVDCSGNVNDYDFVDGGYGYGVRAVITLEL
jgi:prepilin-type N-terminal cleavage/methylation domain-containing protein